MENKDFTEHIIRKFPSDGRMGFYKKPDMPASKLGKALTDYTKIKSPSEVVAFYQYGGFFGGGSIIFTSRMCFYEKSSFYLDDIKSATASEGKVQIFVNQGGTSAAHILKTENDEAAKLLASFFDSIPYIPKTEELLVKIRVYEEEGFDKNQVNWLKLRDEVLITIEKLHDLFQDGKIGLMEYESTKTDLLARL